MSVRQPDKPMRVWLTRVFSAGACFAGVEHEAAGAPCPGGGWQVGLVGDIEEANRAVLAAKGKLTPGGVRGGAEDAPARAELRPLQASIHT